jgi:hypothetical protein
MLKNYKKHMFSKTEAWKEHSTQVRAASKVTAGAVSKNDRTQEISKGALLASYTYSLC